MAAGGRGGGRGVEGGAYVGAGAARSGEHDGDAGTGAPPWPCCAPVRCAAAAAAGAAAAMLQRHCVGGTADDGGAQPESDAAEQLLEEAGAAEEEGTPAAFERMMRTLVASDAIPGNVIVFPFLSPTPRVPFRYAAVQSLLCLIRRGLHATSVFRLAPLAYAPHHWI